MQLALKTELETRSLRAAARTLAYRAATRLVELHALKGTAATLHAIAGLVGLECIDHDQALGDWPEAISLGELLGLGPNQIDALICFACVELDPRLRELADELAGGTTGDLLAELVYGELSAELLADLGAGSPLVTLGLIDGTGMLRRPIAIARRVIAWLLGDRDLDPVARGVLAESREVRSSEDVEQAIARNVVPVIVGPVGVGKTALAVAAAQRRGFRAIISDARDLDAAALRVLDREAQLLGAVWIAEHADALWDDNRDRRSTLAQMRARIVLCSTSDAFRPTGFARPTRRFELDVPSPAQRAALWARELGGSVAGVERYRVTAGTIARAAAATQRPATPSTFIRNCVASSRIGLPRSRRVSTSVRAGTI